MQINRDKHNIFVVPNTGVTVTQPSTNQSTTEDTTQTTTGNLPVTGINSGGNMSMAEQDKLEGIEEGAQVNQEAFSYISVNGTDTITAQEEMSTFGITAGENIILTVSGDVITISCPNTEILEAIATLNEALTLLQNRVSSIESSISSLQSDVSSLESDVSSLDSGVYNLQRDVNSLESDISDLETNYTDLESRVTALEDSASSSQ